MQKGLVYELDDLFFQSKNSILTCASFSLVCFLRKNIYLELVLPTLRNAYFYLFYFIFCLCFLFCFVCFYDKVVITGTIRSIDGMDVSITTNTET